MKSIALKIPAARGRRKQSGRMVSLIKSLKRDEPQIISCKDLMAAYDAAYSLAVKIQTSRRSVAGYITLKPGQALVWRIFETETK